MSGYFLGVDVGSVSTKLVVLDEKDKVYEKIYLRTKGQPVKAIQEGLRVIRNKLPANGKILAVGTTGSGRKLASVMIGADVTKNEITAHAVAALSYYPDVKTILEIGGQDSKIIILRDGVVSDFAMNTVCAAGTGSFLDRQAERLNIPIERFGALALEAKGSVRIAGRCAVFAESDMIHKQQLGHNTEDIVKGLCEALVRNYLNNLGKGKEIKEPIIFQGGVAANIGIKAAFEDALGYCINVPEHYDVMGAIGSGILAKEEYSSSGKTNFHGFSAADIHFTTKSWECDDCPNSCEVLEFLADGQVITRWGDKCGKWAGELQEGSSARDKLA